ncbi:MAG: hypothetical protein JRN68_06605 [Nitrososphaerota archaeon]|nr:hypothetical protein [Nitrososphaerota archaeon]
MTQAEIVQRKDLTVLDVNVELAVDLAHKLDEFYRRVLKPGIDYVVLPGTQKPCLKKEGAELLSIGFNFETHTEIVSSKVITEPDNVYFEYEAKCTLYKDGVKVKDAVAAANSRERQFAFRWVDADSVSKDSKTYGERMNEGRRQVRVALEPWEVYSLQNQVLKMADKRAFVGAVLRATGASRIFTQDLDEEEANTATSSTTNTQQQQQRQDKATDKQVALIQQIVREKPAAVDILDKFLEAKSVKSVLLLSKEEASQLIQQLMEA